MQSSTPRYQGLLVSTGVQIRHFRHQDTPKDQLISRNRRRIGQNDPTGFFPAPIQGFQSSPTGASNSTPSPSYDAPMSREGGGSRKLTAMCLAKTYPPYCKYTGVLPPGPARCGSLTQVHRGGHSQALTKSKVGGGGGSDPPFKT